MTTKSLAKIVGDISDLETFVANDEFLAVVNQEPPKQFIKNHPMASGVKYIPIDKIEMMLTKVFQQWRVEIRDSGQLLNSIFVNVRLHYLHPISGEWTFQDGTGAMAIQVDKGENASNLSAVKSNAIMLALPAAKSYAIKDAAENIGKVFGRDINRKDTMAFNPSYATQQGKVLSTKQKKQAIKDSLK